MTLPLTNIVLNNYSEKFTIPSVIYGVTFVENNDYIPVFAVKESRVYQQGDKKTIMYNYGNSVTPRFNSVAGKRTKLLNELLNNLHRSPFSSGAYYDETSLVFRKTNFLYTDDGTILLALCLPVKKVYTLTKKSKIGNKDVILLRNTALDNDPKYKKLNLSLKKSYMQHIKDSNIDVLNSDDIHRFMFNPVGLTPNFSSIEEMTDYLSNIRTFIYGNNQFTST